MESSKKEPDVRLDCKQSLVRAIRFNADGQYALTCGSDRTIKLWRPTKLLQLKCYKGHSADVTDAQANRDSSQFVSCSNDKSVISWDVESGKILRRFRNLAPFNTISYGGQEASTLLAGSVDGTVRIYDLRALNAWEPIQSLTEASESVTCCKVHQQYIFTTSMDKCLRTYDVRKGQLSIDTLHMPLNCVSVSNDGRLILVSCVRGSNVILVDRNEGKILNEFRGHENKLFKIESCFARQDSLIVSGSEDGKAYVWSATQSSSAINEAAANNEPHKKEDNKVDRLKLATANAAATTTSLAHTGVHPPIIQSISSNSLIGDHLLTACGSFMFMWSL